jgi:hypothetical protein
VKSIACLRVATDDLKGLRAKLEARGVALVDVEAEGDGAIDYAVGRLCDGGAMMIVTTRRLVDPGMYAGGSVPYGRAVGDDGELVDNEDEQKVIAEARRLRAEGFSLRRLAEQLAAAGVRNREGGAFLPTQVWRLLRAKKT